MLSPPLEPSDHANKIHSLIYNTALNTIGYRKCIKTHKPWRNSEIAVLQKTVKRMRRKLENIKQKHPEFYDSIPKYNRMYLEYKNMRNHKCQVIKKAEKIYQILQNSSFDDKLSWRLIRKNDKSTPNNIPLLNYNHKTITDPSSKAEILHSVLCHPNPPNLDPIHIQFHNFIDNQTKQINPTISQTDTFDILNSPIHKYEVINCIHALNRAKAYGPDLIHNQMIINGGPPLWDEFLTLFNNCLAKGLFPRSGVLPMFVLFLNPERSTQTPKITGP